MPMIHVLHQSVSNFHIYPVFQAVLSTMQDVEGRVSPEPVLKGIFFFFNGHTHNIWKFPGKGSNPSNSCDLCHSCSNVGSFNLLHWGRGSNPFLCSDLSCCSQILNLLCHSGNSKAVSFLKEKNNIPSMLQRIPESLLLLTGLPIMQCGECRSLVKSAIHEK